MKTTINLARCLWVAALCLLSPFSFAQNCAPAAAKIVTIQGRVEISPSGARSWKAARIDDALCAGQQIRVLRTSRAVLVLANQALLHLDESTVLTLNSVHAEKPSWVELLKGFLHVISRVPQSLGIKTPYVNASVEGTEFALQVGNAETALWVYEGRVRFSNTLGQLLIASGEAAAAAPGRAPERRIVVKPRRAVEWALYYPPLLDTRPERYPEALRAALAAYRQNDLPAAFARLEALSPKDHTGIFFTLRAGLLLSVGRVAEAEREIEAALKGNRKEGTALALRAVIAMVRNETEEALRLAQEAVTAEPRSPTPYVARSYAEQSAFKILPARKSLEEASRLAPKDALVWARLAEIELSLGDLDAALEAARKAGQLDPGISRTQTMLGFAYLTRIEVDRAKTAFERAIALDPADPLPRLGLGLARIRDGDIDAGTKEIEIAASLDPNNSLIRSYLGKAYFEQKRGGLAESELEQAKLLDPKDPTPWFYSAIHKQTTNRPVEALHDLQYSIDLNDNRAVYRSRLLLDADLAARSAALGRIYRDLGFEQRALVEGWKSVTTDPGDYSGHRLLADSYSALPRHEIARVSELLQSQLLQPLNLTPVQANLAERDLLSLEGSGPAAPAFNEFNSLFLRNRFTLQASGAAGSHETYADEITHAGVWDRLSYSLGQYHYDTNGFRANNDLKQDVYNVFVQGSLSPTLSLQAEARHRDIEHGDLFYDFDLDNFSQDFRRSFIADSLRAGAHYTPAPHSDFIASFTYRDQEINFEAPFSDDSQTSHGAIGEIQYLLTLPAFKAIGGGGYYDVRHNPELRDSFHLKHGNAYGYAYIRWPDPVTLILGASVDALENEDPKHSKHHFNRFNPKIGMLWDVTTNTTLRMAFFKTLKRAVLFDQTIEPTQVAGFNQFFDDFEGTEARRYGVGIDHRFSPNLSAGVELSRREAKRPVANLDGTFIIDTAENLRRAYLHWTPHARIAAGVSVESEDFNAEPDLPAVETLLVPAQIGYFAPNGFHGTVGATLVHQDVENQGEDEFVLFDATLGYRLPRRYGVVRVGVSNLLDQKFNFRGLNIQRSPPRETVGVPMFAPERTLFAQLTFAF